MTAWNALAAALTLSLAAQAAPRGAPPADKVRLEPAQIPAAVQADFKKQLEVAKGPGGIVSLRLFRIASGSVMNNLYAIAREALKQTPKPEQQLYERSCRQFDKKSVDGCLQTRWSPPGIGAVSLSAVEKAAYGISSGSLSMPKPLRFEKLWNFANPYRQAYVFPLVDHKIASGRTQMTELFVWPEKASVLIMTADLP